MIPRIVISLAFLISANAVAHATQIYCDTITKDDRNSTINDMCKIVISDQKWNTSSSVILPKFEKFSLIGINGSFSLDDFFSTKTSLEKLHIYGSVMHVIQIPAKLESLLVTGCQTRQVVIANTDEYRYGIHTLVLVENKISEIPHRIDKLIQLKSLHMANNLLEKVNFTEFNGLKELNFVDLSFNRIRVVSIEMVDLPKLLKLDLSQNFLKSIPRNFGQLRALDDLNLSHNKLEYVEISHFNGLTKLKVLDLQFNNLLIGSLAPAILPALEVLRLESCYLQQLDLFGIEMPKLKKLYLNDNKLEYVEWFNKDVYQGAGLNLYGDRNPWNCNWLPEMHPRVKFVRQQDRIICRRFEKNVCCVGNDYTTERKADRRWQVVKEQNREIFMVLEEQQGQSTNTWGEKCGMIGVKLG
uniref:Leucine rich protein n=1 Tax=Aedes albopictus TaxID=7160 RepID=Q5MIQ1_AEDAL|nr:leucine rich protein [Aedes albopictus]